MSTSSRASRMNFSDQVGDNRPVASNLKVCSSKRIKSASKEEQLLSGKMYRSSVYILNKVSVKTHVKVCSQADLRQPLQLSDHNCA